MKVLSLFDGMSCGRIALDRAGIPVAKYYASELDQHAIKVTQANWPNTVQLGDVTKWREWDIDWSGIDLLIGGSPCQGFSFAGKQLAFDDPRSKLFFVYVDILNHIRSLNPDVKFLLENVKMKKEHLAVITEQLGVEPVRINTNYIMPVNRDRFYWFSWEMGSIDSSKKKSVLELPDIGEYRPSTVKRTKEGNFVVFTENLRALTTYCEHPNGIGRPSLSLKEFEFGSRFPKGDTCKPLSPRQCEWLQTVPDGYTAHVSDIQRYKMLGNGFTVDVIAHILVSMPR